MSAAPVASVVVSPATANVTVGQTTALTAIPEDASGNPLSGRSVTWTTNKATIATVSSSGIVTGMAQGGATITAASGSVSGTASVTVSPVPVATVVVSPSTAAVTVAQTTTLTANPEDASGNPLSGRTITWTTSNTTIATVSSSGVVTGVAQGSATITAASGNATGIAGVTVNPIPVASVVVAPATASVTIGLATTLTATPEDASGNPLTGRTVTWSTSNASVATVSSSGVVTGVAQGSATITASSGSVNGTASVTVSPVAVASVNVSPTSASITVGQTAQLSATPKDANGNPIAGQPVTWTTSSAALATVSLNGLVSGIAVGAATVTATSGGRSGSATITVGALSSPGWPNDPYSLGTAGWYLISDYGFTDPLPDGSVDGQMLGSSYWVNDYGAAIGGGLTKVRDATAPNQNLAGWSDSVLSFNYDSGYVAGVAPATLYFNGPQSGGQAAGEWFSSGGTTQTYMGFWFKHSSNWYGEAACVNKMTEFFDNGSGNPGNGDGSYFYEACGVGNATLYPQGVIESIVGSTLDLSCCNVASVPLTTNTWHRGEVLWQYTGAHVGNVTFWVDGTMVIQATGITLGGTAFNSAQVYPDWGGGGDTLRVTQHFYVAHVRITGHP